METTHSETPTASATSSARRDIDWSKLGWGVAILIVGLLVTLDRFDLLETDHLWRWTPLALVAIGGIGLIRGRDAKERDGGWWLVIIGLYLLLNFLEPWNFYWHNSWPVLLILIGLSKLIDPEKPGERASSGWFLGVGGFFLIVQRDLFGLDIDDLWPVLLIVAGLALTWRGLVRGRGKEVRHGS